MANTPKDEAIKKAKLEAIAATREQAKRIEEVKIKSLQAKEGAMLALATALLELKFDFDLSWVQLAKQLGEYVDSTTLYKFSMREIYLKDKTYHLLTGAVNSFLKKNGKEEIDFPSYYYTPRL